MKLELKFKKSFLIVKENILNILENCYLLEEKILKLQEDLLKKEKDLSIIKSYVCSHLGCGSRCPLREQAETWIEDLKNNKAHVDYNPMFCTVYKIANEDDDEKN